MSDPKVDIEIVQGETLRFRFAYLKAGVPVNLAGYSFSSQIRADFDSPAVAALSSANGKIGWDAATGTFELRLSAAETLKLKLDDVGVWDLFCKAPDGIADRLVYGDVSFVRAVTR